MRSVNSQLIKNVVLDLHGKPEEGGPAQTKCDELTTTPIPHPPKLLSGEEAEKIRSKVKTRKKGGVGERYFKISVYFSLSCSGLISSIK